MNEQASAYKVVEGNVPFQWAWDNSSLALLRTCPRKYYYEIIRGLRPKGGNVHLEFGLMYHAALEYHDRLLAEGVKNPVLRTRSVMRKILTDSFGWQSDHKLKTRQVLVRAVLGYIDHFKFDATKTVLLDNGKPAVELSFRFEMDLDTPWGEPYALCGHLDRIAELDQGNYVLDRKTTQKAFQHEYIEKYKPSGQMMQYTAGAKVGFHADVKGVIIDACYLGTNLDEYGRFMAGYTKDQIAEWLENTKFYIKMAEQYHAANLWPQNFEACHVYAGCHFRDLCGRDPAVRPHFEKTMYEVRRWDPLQTREVE